MFNLANSEKLDYDVAIHIWKENRDFLVLLQMSSIINHLRKDIFFIFKYSNSLIISEADYYQIFLV